MTRGQLFLRTFGWAAVGFLLTNGVVVAITDAIDVGDYATGVRALVLSAIAAAIAAVIAALQSMKWPVDTAWGKAVSQFCQMIVGGAATLVVSDLTTAAAVAFGAAAFKLVVASLLGAVQAYLVNLPRPPVQPPVVP